ncbi:MAG: hypothetical protein RLZZ628_4340 [Bacteroidota bacterium]|jgi:hypothetical protein
MELNEVNFFDLQHNPKNQKKSIPFNPIKVPFNPNSKALFASAPQEYSIAPYI